MAVDDISDEEARRLGIAPPEISDDEAARLGIRPKHGQLETAVLHGGSGALSGFLDEAGGAVASGLSKLGLWNTGEVPIAQDKTGKPLPNQPQRESVYEEVRNGVRQDLKESAVDNPGTALAANVGGGLLASAAGGIAAKAGTKAGNVVGHVLNPGGAGEGLKGALKSGAIGGTVSGFGEAEGDVADQATSTVIGTGLGAGLGLVGALTGKGYRALKDSRTVAKANVEAAAKAAKQELPFTPKETEQILDEAFTAEQKAQKGKLTDALLNEVAEGKSGKRTTPTQARHLSKKGEAITEELVDGPDADTVRGAILDKAEKGRAVLRKVIAPLTEKNDHNYSLFEKAGRAEINAEKYAQDLLTAANKANAKGKTRDTDLGDFLKEKFEAMWERNGGKVDLRQLRGWTTEVQEQAASAIGGYGGHAPAKLKARAGAIITKAMVETLKDQAGADKALLRAAEDIGKNNKRISALATVDQALEMRQSKENTEAPLVRRIAEAGAGAAVASAGGALLGEEGNRGTTAAGLGVIGLGGGLGARRIAPAVGRYLQRAKTTADIRAAREATKLGRRAVAERAANRVGAVASQAASLPAVRTLQDELDDNE